MQRFKHMIIESTLHTMESQEQKSISLARTGQRPAVLVCAEVQANCPTRPVQRTMHTCPETKQIALN